MKIASAFLLPVLLAATLRADAASIKVAIISDTDNKDLAALVATELTSGHAVDLVERDDLARVGTEAKLQQLAGSDAAALGKLVGADGLVFLDKRSDGSHVRVTAVNLGYALFDDAIPSGTNPAQAARVLAHRITDYAAKLKLSPALAIPISVLNLRADYAIAHSDEVERKLTLLLESRLASLPQYVVLERRHAGSLGFEHTLAPEAAPLMEGVFVVDGSLSFPLQNQGAGDLVVHLRLRSSGHPEMPLEIRGPLDDLPALVEQIAAAIGKATGTTANAPLWRPEKEAREYLEEGIWGWRHHADDAALEALDSAELLGETAPDLIAARIALLGGRAAKGMDLDDNRADQPPPSPPTLDQRTDDTLEAIREAARYSDEKMESKLQLIDPRQNLDVRSGEIKSDLSLLASKLLVHLDAANFPRAEELRQALRAITGYDPLHGKLGAGFFAHPWLQRDVFADQWAGSLEEELAYYRLLLTWPNQFISPWLITGQGKNFCQRFLKSPEEQKAAFDQLVESLKDDPAGKLSYFLIRSGSADAGTADAAYQGYLHELWNRRETICAGKEMRCEWTNLPHVADKPWHRAIPAPVALLRYFLTHVANLEKQPHALEVLWQPDDWSETDAAAIWSDYGGFKQRVTDDWTAHQRNQDALDMALAPLEASFHKKFPHINAPEASAVAPLVFSRFWAPSIHTDSAKVRFIIPNTQVTDEGLLVLGSNHASPATSALFLVSLPGFQTQRIEITDAGNSRSARATPDAFYVEYYKRNDSTQYLARFDRKTQVWEERAIKTTFSDTQFYVVAGTVYWVMREGGLARYDWDKNEVTLLASSRRKPPQNQFDNSPDYQVTSVFAGPGQRPCALIGNGVYYLQDQPGNWEQVYDTDYFTSTRMQKDKTLVWSQDGEVVLLDPAQPAPQYLMTPAQPHYRKVPLRGQKGVQEMAPWAAQAPWDAPEIRALKSNGTRESTIGLHGDDLFVLVSPAVAAESYELLVYNRKTGRSPRRIPLQFHMEEATRAQLAPIYDSKDGPATEWTMDKLEAPHWPFFQVKLVATDQGLCLVSYVGGFWFLSYGEIDAYLKANPELVHTP